MQQRKFTARAKDPDGFDITGKTVTWRSSDPLTASIAADGTATAEKNGKVTVKALIDGVESLPVDLETQQVTRSIEIAGDNTPVPALNRKRKFTARAKDENGFDIEGKTASWSSTNTAVPIDPATGEITAKGNGTSTVKASIDGIEGTLSLTVDQVVERLLSADTGKLKALNRTRSFTAADADGNPISGKTITWSSSDSATISVSGGVAAARKNGTARVRATVGATTVESDLTVEQEVRSMELSGDTSKIPSFNAKRKITAIVRDLDGYVIEGRTPSWTSSNPVNLTVDAAGEVTSKKNGTASITATVDGVSSAPLNFEVSQVVASVEPAAGETSGKFRSKGETRQYMAKDAGGSPIEKLVTWRVTGDTPVANVDSSGRVTARQNKRGKATSVTATADGTTVSSDIDVEQVAVSVVIQEPSKSLRLDKTLALQATAYDANNNVVEDKPIAWSVDNPLAASVVNNVFTGRLLDARVRVTARVDNAMGTIDLTVGR